MIIITENFINNINILIINDIVDNNTVIITMATVIIITIIVTTTSILSPFSSSHIAFHGKRPSEGTRTEATEATEAGAHSPSVQAGSLEPESVGTVHQGGGEALA